MRAAGDALRRVTAVAATGALAMLSACAPPHAPPPGRPAVLRIVATDSSFVTPDSVPSGFTEVRLINTGHEIHECVLAHCLNALAIHGTYVDSVRAGVELPAFAEDVGGPGLASPGDSTIAWLDLPPGRYGVYCWNGDHIERGIARDFEVVPSTHVAAPPAADLHVGMFEYGYALAGSWRAGRHTLLAENGGVEPHEFDCYRLVDAHTPDDFMAWVHHGRRGPAPAIAVGGTGDFVPGPQVWIQVTLSRGRYVAFCEVPARSDHQPHYHHGMHQEIVVP